MKNCRRAVLITLISFLPILGFTENREHHHPTVHQIEHQEQSEHPASHHGDHHAAKPTSVQLPASLKQLLVEEMQALQNAITLVSPAIVIGNWTEVERVGLKMNESYILKQKLTAEQREELHHILPDMFRELDSSFHHYAAKLADAAKKKDAELITVYYQKMIETCVKCHSKYATARFPDFIKP